MIVRRTVYRFTFINILLLVVLIALGVWYFGTAVPRPYETPYTNAFWGWTHGLMIVPDLIGLLFSDNIAIYQTPNNGMWYDVGFVVGILMFCGMVSNA